MSIIKPYPPEKKKNAINLLSQSLKKDGNPNFSEVSRQTNIHSDTLKRWWMQHLLEHQTKVRSQLERTITTALERIQQLSQETQNLKELAPVVKMLSEISQEISSETEGEW